MIAAGKKLAREQGCSALRIREIVDGAGVNLGMFHYHFKSRKRFTRALLSEVYGEFFAKLSTAASSGSGPLAQLRGSVIVMGQCLREERKILFALLRDVLSGEGEVIRFSKRKIPPHAVIFHGLVERCQREGLLPKLPLSQIMPLLLATIVTPLMINEVLEKTGRKIPWFNPEDALSDKAIAQRVDVVLSGMRAFTK